MKNSDRDYIEFKGGTSLSKGYNLINRFSEDVDLVLDSSLLGIDLEDILSLETRNQKSKKTQLLEKEALDFYKATMIPTLETEIRNELNKDIELYLHEKESSIYVRYTSSFDDDYVNSDVKLEIGPLAAWTPNEKVEIHSFIQELYPELCNAGSFPVLVTLPKRTFWEKAVILHQEAHRSDGKVPRRYSRHYYDLYRMYFSKVKDEALTDFALLEEVRKFTLAFYYRSWSNFESAKPGSLKLYPAKSSLVALSRDYSAMRSMIFGDDIPQFDEILAIMRQLENEIN